MTNSTSSDGIIVTTHSVTPNSEVALSTLPIVAEAYAALDAAQAGINALTGRLAEAAEAVTEAKAVRTALVDRAASGESVKPAELRKADAAIADAEANEALLRDAMARPNEALAEAQRLVVVAEKAEAERRFAVVKARRIAAAEELDRLGAEYGEAARAFLAIGDELGPVLNGLRLAIPRHQIADMHNRRLVAFPIPKFVQEEAGYAHALIAPGQRLTWG